MNPNEQPRMQKMLDYLLNNVQTGVKMMLRDKAALHVFDYDAEGKYIFVMAVVPKGSIPEALLVPSVALQHEGNDVRIVDPGQSEHQGNAKP